MRMDINVGDLESPGRMSGGDIEPTPPRLAGLVDRSGIPASMRASFEDLYHNPSSHEKISSHGFHTDAILRHPSLSFCTRKAP